MKRVMIFLLFSVSVIQSVPWNYGDIHVIGDSHSLYTFTNLYTSGIPPIHESELENCEVSFFAYQGQVQAFEVPFHIHWISRTMHMIGKLGLEQVDFRRYDMKDGDFGLMVFGGIDAYHGGIIKQYVFGRELDEIVDTLAKGYIETIRINQSFYNQLTVIIMAVVPPIILGHNKNAYKQRDPNLPYEKFIVVSNRMLNEALACHCEMNGFIYLDVTSSFEDRNGLLRGELSDRGGHHINPAYNYIVKQKLIDLILDDIKNGTARHNVVV